jgi:hypothetical protein
MKVISIKKRPTQHEKNTSNMAATIGDVMDDVTVQVLYMDDPGLTH